MADVDVFERGNPEALEAGQYAVIGINKDRDEKKTFDNVLNSYRSVTYNFTMSVLNASDLKNHSYLKNNNLKNVILKSGGRGSSKIENIESITNPVYDKNDYLENQARERETLKINKDVIDEYNKSGIPDFYIDQLEMEGLGLFNPDIGTSLGTKLRFTVFEPRGVSGFLEALHVASVSAGYPTYTYGTVFLLKITFWGFPDNIPVEESKPKLIDAATRYFPFIIRDVAVELTSDGTKYACEAIHYGDQGFGNPNVLKSSVNMSGSTVKEILENLFVNLNQQIVEGDKKQKNDTYHDVYEIKFPEKDSIDGSLDFESVNDIGKSKVSFLNQKRHIYSMEDPGEDPLLTKNTASTKRPDDFKYSPTSKIKVQFNENRNIHECIEGIIVDSEYVRKIINDLEKRKIEFVDYFIIQIYVENLPQFNPITKNFYKKYTYVVTPYRVHSSKIPGYQTTFDAHKLQRYIWKRYNYTFTGKNIDVLNFKINFNRLYFDAVPFALARTELPNFWGSTIEPTAELIRNTDKSAIELKNAVRGNGINQPNPNYTTAQQIQQTAGSSGTPINYGDSYQILSRNIHQAIVGSTVSANQGELEILGDPCFISSTVNSSVKIDNNELFPNLSKGGYVDLTYGELFIEINFRTPEQFQTTEDGGLIKFKKAPFSGIYRVMTAKSVFADGVFKQILKVQRVSGQVDTIRDKSSVSNATSRRAETLETVIPPAELYTEQTKTS